MSSGSEKSPRIVISGWGAVSPAGWSAAALGDAVEAGAPLPSEEIHREGRDRGYHLRTVPKLTEKLPFLRDARLRRASPVGRYCAAAAMEALGEERARAAQEGALRLGIVTTFLNGCVNFSHRFFGEVLEDPALASPILFPETVFNAPSSHLSALLRSTEVNYTLLGDPAQFLGGLEVAARWLLGGEVDGCLVVAGEEHDWLSAEAYQLFDKDAVIAEGAGALYLETSANPGIELRQVTDPELFTNTHPRTDSVRKVREQISAGPENALLVESADGVRGASGAEQNAWADWTGKRLAPRAILGEGMGVSTAWQCVVATEMLSRGACQTAVISACAGDEQASAAVFGNS